MSNNEDCSLLHLETLSKEVLIGLIENDRYGIKLLIKEIEQLKEENIKLKNNRLTVNYK